MDAKEVQANVFYRRPHGPPLLIERGEGVYLFTADGDRILDASGGPMVVTIGHGRKEIGKVAAALFEKLDYVLPVYATEGSIELTKRIKRLTPEPLNRVYFTSGGSESVESAIKLARQYHVITGNESKYKFIGRKRSYHGGTIATLSVGATTARREPFLPLLWDSPHIEACYCYRCPFGKEHPGCEVACAADLERCIVEEGPDTVAAFIAEPVGGACGAASVPPPEYFPAIRATCDKYNVLFIADEVVTGFGRTGKATAMEHFGAVPDIMTFAKGASSGYAPLGGIVATDHILEQFEEKRKEFSSIFTFSSHPLSCAIGNAVLKIVEEEGLIERVAAMEGFVSERLQTLYDSPFVGDVRGKGMLWGIEFVKDRETKEPFPAGRGLLTPILAGLSQRGIFLYPGIGKDEQGRGDSVLFTPPFIITEAEIDLVVTALHEVLKSLEAEYLD